jgi:uncharacterized protein (DUF488 family)
MNLYTIGFTKKNAKEFFETLKKNGVKILIDIRLNNKSQLAGFTKQDDLEYFLDKICGIKYIHMPNLAPTKDILKRYQEKALSWKTYEKDFNDLLVKRNAIKDIKQDLIEGACLLCSEPTADQCHRRLAAEYIKNHFEDIAIVHL